MANEIETIQLLSGCNVCMSENVYDDHFCSFDENKYFYFSNIINSGLYFPQIMQFVCVMFCICKRNTSFGDIFLCNLVSGIGYTVAWYIFKLYKFLPGVSFLSCLIGGNIFRYYLHFLAIALVSLLAIGDWKVIAYCLAGGFISGIVRPILFRIFSTVKYNDGVVKFVSRARS